MRYLMLFLLLFLVGCASFNSSRESYQFEQEKLKVASKLVIPVSSSKEARKFKSKINSQTKRKESYFKYADFNMITDDKELERVNNCVLIEKKSKDICSKEHIDWAEDVGKKMSKLYIYADYDAYKKYSKTKTLTVHEIEKFLLESHNDYIVNHLEKLHQHYVNLYNIRMRSVRSQSAAGALKGFSDGFNNSLRNNSRTPTSCNTMLIDNSAYTNCY